MRSDHANKMIGAGTEWRRIYNLSLLSSLCATLGLLYTGTVTQSTRHFVSSVHRFPLEISPIKASATIATVWVSKGDSLNCARCSLEVALYELLANYRGPRTAPGGQYVKVYLATFSPGIEATGNKVSLIKLAKYSDRIHRSSLSHRWDYIEVRYPRNTVHRNGTSPRLQCPLWSMSVLANLWRRIAKTMLIQ